MRDKYNKFQAEDEKKLRIKQELRRLKMIDTQDNYERKRRQTV